VATVTLADSARRNAMTPQMWEALADVPRGLPGDVRVLVLRAEGPAFSAGLDRRMFTPEGVPGAPSLGALTSMTDSEMDATIASWQEAFLWWRRADLLSVAAVQGHAVGGGFQLALGCDLRVVADDVAFSMKETSLGLVPDLGGTKRLTDLVGLARALEMCVTARQVGAAEAVASGLAVLAVPRDQLDAATADLVAALAAAPRDAVTETKALLLHAGQRGYDDQLAAERAAQIRRLRDLAGGGE
jgi:enoyl-CoA hydratase/carnithine racemase